LSEAWDLVISFRESHEKKDNSKNAETAPHVENQPQDARHSLQEELSPESFEESREELGG
jgi:hypothetical protein